VLGVGRLDDDDVRSTYSCYCVAWIGDGRDRRRSGSGRKRRKYWYVCAEIMNFEGPIVHVAHTFASRYIEKNLCSPRVLPRPFHRRATSQIFCTQHSYHHHPAAVNPRLVSFAFLTSLSRRK
jgi:hypothetical protein